MRAFFVPVVVFWIEDHGFFVGKMTYGESEASYQVFLRGKNLEIVILNDMFQSIYSGILDLSDPSGQGNFIKNRGQVTLSIILLTNSWRVAEASGREL